MSRHVASLVYRKRLGSIARKAIMAYCAERANDDGSGVWASKVTISKEVECSKQTVIDTMRNFVAEGLMIEVGHRKCANGFVVEYAINVPAIRALEDAISEEDLTGPILDPSSQLTPRGQASGPQEVKPVDPNRPLTVLKPSTNASVREPLLLSEEDAPKIDKAEEAFKRFWAAYPVKSGKPAAHRNFLRAVKGGVDPEEIVAGAIKYRDWLSSACPGEFRPQPKHPQGWITDERWSDDVLKVAAPAPPKPRGPQWGEVVR